MRTLHVTGIADDVSRRRAPKLKAGRAAAAAGALALLAAFVAGAAQAQEPGVGTHAEARPRLLLLIAVDQMRYDYLTRFGPEFDGGLARLLAHGAVFSDAHLEHYPSVTAVGHSTMLSGAPPAASGIVGNDWYERAEGRNVTAVDDPKTLLVGAGGDKRQAASPHRLQVTTLGDELKLAGRGSRVVGVSFKDRAAILMGGRMADAAYWWDDKSGAFVTSTWYRDGLPAWAEAFNARRTADAWAGREWREPKGASGDGAPLATLPAAAGPDLYRALWATAFGNELIAAFAEVALEGEALGGRGVTDVLAVSFSVNDTIGHAKGPFSREVRAVTLETDQAIGRLLATVDRLVGLSRTLVVLTSDHGVSPVPEELAALKLPAGRLSRDELVDAAQTALADTYGPGRWVEGRAGSSLYLDRWLIGERGLDPAAVERTAASGVEKLGSVWRTYTRSELLLGRVPPDPWSRRVLRSFHRERSGDIEVVLEPYWIPAGARATHGSPWSYDTHIPLVLMGAGLRPGRYDAAVALNDLAPTLATLLAVETPSGSSGRVLSEALAR